MPKKKAKAIADAADMVVDGFAVSRHELGYKIVNLNWCLNRAWTKSRKRLPSAT